MTSNENSEGHREPGAAAEVTSEERETPQARAAAANQAVTESAGGMTTRDVASLDVADGLERSLDPRVVSLGRLVGWIVVAIVSPGLLIALGVALWLMPLPLWADAALAVLCGALTLGLVWLAQVWPAVEYRHASYKVDHQGIEIRRGVLWREVLSVPRSRVQHTDVSQGPLERSFGLGTLVIYTAGTDYARVELRGLEHGLALRIRDHLLPREGGDAV